MLLDYEVLDFDDFKELENLVIKLKENGDDSHAVKMLDKAIEYAYEEFINDGICPLCGGEIVSEETSSATLEEPAYGHDYCSICGEEYGDW